jgi:NAD(P)-dependent dehydrogenase (short-subunit alcohol dehydrogenase family)
MIKLHEEIAVQRSIEDCFRYVSDFRTVSEWDATARTSSKSTQGPIGLGTRFIVHCAVGPTKVRLEYEIVDYCPWASVVLVGKSRFFEVRDVITFTEKEAKTYISYTADFKYHLGLGSFENRLEYGMRDMGRKSLEGLKKALDTPSSPPTLSKCTARADRWVAPGVAMFSKWGYRRSVAQRKPDSTFLDGQHIVITGANSGLGLATSIALAESGADLTLIIRNPKKREELLTTLKSETGRSDITVEIADLSLMADVRAVSTRLLAKGKPIDVLINNAGALFNNYALTSEGLEQSFALLLASPTLLTQTLLPLLKDHTTPSRVINVVSGGMYTEKLVCQRLIMAPHEYQGAQAYARAKRALTVLGELWAEQWRENNIIVNTMHPGWADTPGVASALPTFRSITKRILRTSEEGADTIIWLARAKEAGDVSGKLFLDREPRTPYLLAKTKESAAQRDQLEDYIDAQIDSASEA